jgi:hypothetical protein
LLRGIWADEFLGARWQRITAGKKLGGCSSGSNIPYFILSMLPNYKKLSNGHFPVPHCNIKAHLEEYARAKKQDTTFIHAAFYYENFLNYFHKIKSAIEEQPKSVIRQFRILLFPEYGATEYYKLVFGRILFWMLIFLVATYLFTLGKQYMNVIVKINKLENDNIRKAWKYLYKNNGKAVKDKMDSAYIINSNKLLVGKSE